MKKGQVYEATVERVDFPNKGIALTEEGAVTVKNSLPGQKIRLGISKVRNGKAEGRLLEVLEKSPLETEAPCSHFGVCGGCTYLSLPYEEQLRVKEEQVKRLLDACLEGQEENWSWEGIKGSPEVYGYRNKMEFTFGDDMKDGPLTLGMHKRGSFYDVVTVDGCRIVDEDYSLILKTVLTYFGSCPGGKPVRYYHRMRHEGYLRHLVVRKASRTGEILAALVTSSQNPWGEQDGCGRNGIEEGNRGNHIPEEADTQNIPEEADTLNIPGEADTLIEGFLQSLLQLEREGKLRGHFAGIAHIVNDSRADVVHSDDTRVLYGQDYFYEELLGLRFKVSLFSFFQTNTCGAEVLYETAREYVGDLGSDGDGTPDKVVFDLYSGTGTIAQMMASAARRVIGVEIVEEAVQAAVRNAEENGLENCSFIAGDVLKVLDTIEEKPDFIILDPPRDGIHPKALPKIVSYGVEQIVYISCKPTSLVRDLAEFRKGGYQVRRACCVDMFPNTANIETVCLLSR
ncbi:MAG TPA: 23S rRNA (uracil-5-)-methyltransferase RumA [Lachnospiraceae bacterium]|nr:23S rRNA (uracil-5-)-methyltransferase RumA [Lachnospiraceae bacterium]